DLGARPALDRARPCAPCDPRALPLGVPLSPSPSLGGPSSRPASLGVVRAGAARPAPRTSASRPPQPQLRPSVAVSPHRGCAAWRSPATRTSPDSGRNGPLTHPLPPFACLPSFFAT